MPVLAYDTTTGQPVQVPEEQFPELLTQGRIGLPAGSQVHIDGEDGVESVPVEQAVARLAKQPGLSVISGEEKQRREDETKYGGVGQQAITAVEQGLAGPTFGLSEVAEDALLGNKEDILARKRVNPGTAAVSSLAGIIAASALTGGADAVSGLGAGAEEAANVLLNPAISDSFVTSLAKSVAAKGAAGATEGAAIGGLTHLSEEMLGDPDAAGESLLAAMGHGALLGFGGGAVIGAGGVLGKAVLGRLSPHMQSLAETQAAKSVGLAGEERAVGRRLLDDGVIGAGETTEQIVPKVNRAAKAADDKMGELLETADKAGAQGVDLGELLKAAKKNPEAVRAIEQVAGLPSVEEAAVKGLDREAMAFRDLPLADAYALSKAPVMAGIIDTPLAEAGARASRKLGGDFQQAFDDTRLSQDQYRAVKEAVEKHLDKMKAADGSMMMMAGLSLVHGNPMPIALALAKREASRRGASTSAVLLDKLAALRGVERAGQVVDRNIARGVAGVVPGAERAPVRPRYVQHAAGEDAYESRVRAVMSAMGADHSGVMADVAPHAPNIARAFQSTATRATAYLASMIPKHTRPPSLTPQFDPPPPTSPAQKARFMRAFDAMHDPMSVLADAAAARVTKDQVKALAVVYPALYARVVQQAQDRLADTRTPLTSVQRSQVSILLQRPDEAERTRLFQSTYHAPESTGPTQNQEQQHANKDEARRFVPKRPIESPSRQTALTVGRPPGS